MGINRSNFLATGSRGLFFAKAVASSIGHGMTSENVLLDKVEEISSDLIGISYRVTYSAHEVLFTSAEGSVKVLSECLFTSVYSGGFNAYLSKYSFDEPTVPKNCSSLAVTLNY